MQGSCLLQCPGGVRALFKELQIYLQYARVKLLTFWSQAKRFNPLSHTLAPNTNAIYEVLKTPQHFPERHLNHFSFAVDKNTRRLNSANASVQAVRSVIKKYVYNLKSTKSGTVWKMQKWKQWFWNLPWLLFHCRQYEPKKIHALSGELHFFCGNVFQVCNTFQKSRKGERR